MVVRKALTSPDVNFAAFLLSDMHGSRTRNTRGACDENEKDEIWN